MRDRDLILVIVAGLALLALAGGGGYVMYQWELDSVEGKKWAPVLAAAEQQYGLPPGLLSRQAAEESSFDPAVIYGTTDSPAGASGIMQLMPSYFSSVQVPRPFTDSDVTAQIYQAAAEDARLYAVFGDWSLALAAYNWGQGNLTAWANGGSGDTSLWPAETQKYVSDIAGSVGLA